MDWQYWLGIGLAVLAAIIGVGISKWAKAAKESGHALTAIGAALEDGQITPGELALIIQEVKEVGGAWTDVLTSTKKLMPKK